MRIQQLVEPPGRRFAARDSFLVAGILAAALLAGCLHGDYVEIGVANFTESPKDGFVTISDKNNQTEIARAFHAIPPGAITPLDGGKRIWIANGDYWIHVEADGTSTVRDKQMGHGLTCINIDIHETMIHLGFCDT